MTRFIFFDLDDTLYDQLKPFRDALITVMPELERRGIVMERLFQKVRHYSDRLWDRYCEGKLTLAEVRSGRIIRAFEEFGVDVDETRALQIQADYEREQTRIRPFPELESCFSVLKSRGFHIGVITNGPVEHQLNKLKTLNLSGQFERDRVFVSDAIGIAKPNPELFRSVNERTGTSAEHCYHIGDSWINDIEASYRAGWHSIWLNNRERMPESGIQPWAVIQNHKELIDLLI
ncbi:HAD family hydrolase [Paenibacillus tarimensis]